MTRLAILGACVCLLGSVGTGATVTPHEAVAWIPYGPEFGSLDTTRVDSDDPDRILVRAFRRDGQGRFWVMPTAGLTAGRNLLLGYQDSSLVSAVEFDGYSGDFLVAVDGVYSWGLPRSPGVAGLFAFASHDRLGEATRAQWLGSTEVPVPLAGQLELVLGRPYWVSAGTGHDLAVPLSPGLPAGRIGEGVVRGIPTSEGLLWQDTLLIMRDGAELLDLGLGERGSLWCAFDDGGFVVRRSPEHAATGQFLPVFDIYNSDGTLKRRVTTLPRHGMFGIDRNPWAICSDGVVYQLVLGETGGQVVRY